MRTQSVVLHLSLLYTFSPDHHHTTQATRENGLTLFIRRSLPRCGLLREGEEPIDWRYFQGKREENDDAARKEQNGLAGAKVESTITS